MAEIIDCLLVFWGALGLVVLVFGYVYERQRIELLKRQRKQRGPDTTNLDDFRNSNWRSPTTLGQKAGQGCSSSHYEQTPYSNSTQHYNKSPYGAINNQQSTLYGQSAWKQQVSASPASTSKYADQVSSLHAYSQYASGVPASKLASSDTFHQDPLLFAKPSFVDGHQQRSEQQASATLSSSIPTATGFNSDCVEWVNSILYLFFTQTQKYGPIVAESIYRSLNEKLSNITHSSSDYSHLIIEFTGMNLESCTRPELTNMRTEIESDKSISVCCKIYNKRVSFDISIQQLYSGIGGSSAASEMQADFFGHNRSVQYELILENLEGKLKSVAMLNDKLIVIQFMEKPDTKIILRPIITQDSYGVGAYRKQSAVTLINEDALVQIILQALTQVVVDMYFGDDVDFPQFAGHLSKSGTIKNKLGSLLRIGSGTSDLRRQIKQDFFGALAHGSDQNANRRVFVKILKAKNINYNQNVTCLIELDCPQQQALSTTRPGNSNPNWDEHFLFHLTEKTRELTVELWDTLNSQAQESVKSQSLKRNQNNKQRYKSELTVGGKFLGLARLPVFLDELRKNPVQKLSVPLQPIGSPGDLSNSVGGELAVELLYLENLAHSPSPSPTPSAGGGVGSLKKSTSASSLGVLSSAYVPGDVVSIDRKLTPSGYVITTTTITKQQPPPKQAQSPSIEQTNFDHIGSSASQARADTPAAMSAATGDARSEGAAESLATRSTGGGGRLSRSRSRSLLRAIKKRFSFSRSRSLGPTETGDGETGDYQTDTDSAAGLRAESVTPASSRLDAHGPDYYGSRSRASSEISNQFQQDNRAKSVPTSRDPNEVPTIVINKGRSSVTASAYTFVHPKSQLVIEVLEPTLERENGGSGKQKGKLKYYAIPDDASDKRKWSKRGVKLHLLNEHQFVACHLAGSSTCHLCGRVFSRRPGKQGYKCRNCHLLSHKQCHVKVEHTCPYAASNGLQLEYIDSDPPKSLVDEIRSTTGAKARQRATSESEHYYEGSPSTSGSPRKQKTMRQSMAKSISVEVDDR